jgi:cell wall-associated NlpC family hydrolase
MRSTHGIAIAPPLRWTGRSSAPGLSLILFAMPFARSTRTRHLLVRPILGCTMIVAAAMPAAAQSASRQVTEPRRPFTAWSESVHSFRDSLVTVARAQIGTKYVLGGTTPNGFDCSGLVRYVMAALKVDLPRTAAQQAQTGLEVDRDKSDLRPGDLLTFGKRGKTGVSHIGIYVGNGRYIHASSVAGRVIESDLSRTGSPLIKAWRGVRRMVIGIESDSIAKKGDS